MEKNIIVDTDTFNEVDDQFALIYGLLSKEVSIKAILAAPFFNKNSSSPKDGMEKSYQEIKHILAMLRISDELAFLGSEKYLENEKTYIENPASRQLVQFALNSKEKITVVALAALTNVASAILMEPKIVNNLSVIWLGGHDYHKEKQREFNLRQDVASVKVVFESGVDLVHVPCLGVSNGLVLSLAELECFLDGKNQVGAYLTELFRRYSQDSLSYSRTLADVAAMAYAVNPNNFESIVCPRPTINYDLNYSFDDSNADETKIIDLKRNKIIDDLLYKVIQYADS